MAIIYKKDYNFFYNNHFDQTTNDFFMKALSRNFVLNARIALQAGCNLVLHCNGKINETSKLLRSLNKIDTFTKKKTHQLYEFLR